MDLKNECSSFEFKSEQIRNDMFTIFVREKFPSALCKEASSV